MSGLEPDDEVPLFMGPKLQTFREKIRLESLHFDRHVAVIPGLSWARLA